MADLGELQVTPEELLKKAEEWKGLLERAEKAYERIREVAKGTESCFQGRTAEVFRAEVERRSQQGEEKIADMKHFSDRLTEIAVNYQEAEGENKNVFDRNRDSLRKNEKYK